MSPLQITETRDRYVFTKNICDVVLATSAIVLVTTSVALLALAAICGTAALTPYALPFIVVLGTSFLAFQISKTLSLNLGFMSADLEKQP